MWKPLFQVSGWNYLYAIYPCAKFKWPICLKPKVCWNSPFNTINWGSEQTLPQKYQKHLWHYLTCYKYSCWWWYRLYFSLLAETLKLALLAEKWRVRIDALRSDIVVILVLLCLHLVQIYCVVFDNFWSLYLDCICMKCSVILEVILLTKLIWSW